MLGVVLAAGEGKRFRPVTSYIPKPLVPVGGKRAIDYAVEGLLDTVDGVVVVAGYMGEMVLEYLRRRYGDGVGVYVVRELAKGNSRTLFQVKDLILGQDVLITNADHIFSPEFFIDLKGRKKEDRAILACHREREIAPDEMKVLKAHDHIYISKHLPTYDGAYIGACVVPRMVTVSFVQMLSFLFPADNYELVFKTVPCEFEWMDEHRFFELDTIEDWRKALEGLRDGQVDCV